MKTKSNYPFFEKWFEEMVKTVQETVKRKGIKPALTGLLQSFINAIMEKERELFLREHPENSANGFYNRKLYLSFDALDLRVPRVRFGGTFTPAAILPER